MWRPRPSPKRITLNILPELHSNNITDFLSKEDIVRDTVAQIIKDLSMHGVDLLFTGSLDNAYPELLQKLSVQIDLLMRYDSNRLQAIFYQVDLSEKELMKEEPEFTHLKASELIAHKIIVRDLKKVLLRHYYKSNNL